ncbi:MAG: rod shape-determining protein MreD [Candidatus Hydrogenedentes bacterium]|nr:rod shape-determining protein MreD [Candidatus Hydrogenedentota bacterium]
MRKTLIWVLLIVTAAIVEATWLGALRFQGVLPDLILLLVVYVAIVGTPERAMATGLLGGLFQDVAADSSLGHHVICLVIVGFVVGKLSRRLITDSPAVKVGLVFGAGLLHGIIYVTVSYVQNPDMNALHAIAVSVIPRSFYTALLTPIFYFMLNQASGFPHRFQRDTH